LSTTSTKFLFKLADPTDTFDNDVYLKGNFQIIENLIYSKTEVNALTTYGSNSNGSYIKFDNGVMIAYGSVSAVAGTTVQNTGVLLYPVIFNAAPYTIVQHNSLASKFANWYAYNGAIDGFTLYHQGVAAADLTGTSFRWVAIGRWK
jgi:hypothetical protein